MRQVVGANMRARECLGKQGGYEGEGGCGRAVLRERRVRLSEPR